MSNEDLQKTIEAMRRVTEAVTVSRETALAYLVELGTHKPNGELTDNYKPRA